MQKYTNHDMWKARSQAVPNHTLNLNQKTIFLSLVTSRTYSIRLTANLRAQIDSGDPGLSFGCLTILLASIVIEIFAMFCENNLILRKFDFFDPL